MNFRLKLSRGPNGCVASARNGSRYDLIRCHAVSGREYSADSSLVERCVRLDVTHGSCRKPKLLNERSIGYGQRLADQEFVFIAGPVFEGDDHCVPFSPSKSLDDPWFDCPIFLRADGGVECCSQSLVAMSVKYHSFAELRCIYVWLMPSATL